jgi:hypothetical protein
VAGNGPLGQATVAEDGTFALSWAAWGFVVNAPWPTELRWTPDTDTLLAFGATFPTRTPVAEFPLAAASSSWRILLDSKKLTVAMPGSGVKTVTITGRMQRSIAGQWRPQPGVQVGTPGFAAATTDSSGRFGARSTVQHDQSVGVEVSAPDGLFLATPQDAPSAVVAVDVIPKTRIFLSRSVVRSDRTYAVRGRLVFDLASATDAVRALRLQESKSCSTGWRTVSTIRTGSDSRFDVVRKVPHPTWCLRLRFAGSTTLQASVSSTYRTALGDTRIVGFAVKKPTVPWEPTAVFSGKVQVRGTAGWYSPGKKAHLTVWWKPRQAKYWDFWVPSHATSSTGSFSFSQFVWKDADWYLVATISDGKHLRAYSRIVSIDRP